MKPELKKAYEELFTAVRNVLELSDDNGQEVIVDAENMDDLTQAHYEVYRLKEASCCLSEQ